MVLVLSVIIPYNDGEHITTKWVFLLLTVCSLPMAKMQFQKTFLTQATFKVSIQIDVNNFSQL